MARARRFSASRPVEEARESSCSDRRWYTDVAPVAPRRGLIPMRRVLAMDGREHGGGRLKPLATFLSQLHVNVQESPSIFCHFHIGPWTLNFVYGLDFCYISFDLVWLGISIEINSMLMFYFGSPSFNFRIEFK